MSLPRDVEYFPCAFGEVKEKLYLTRCPFKSLIFKGFYVDCKKKDQIIVHYAKWRGLIYSDDVIVFI